MYQIVLAALVTGFTWIVTNQWGWDVVVRWQNALIERVMGKGAKWLAVVGLCGVGCLLCPAAIVVLSYPPWVRPPGK